ncbi:carboxylating nicotinate-nucleotide diphosphorylase [Bacillaceae bacterium]
MNRLLVNQLLRQALMEDIGTRDLTTELIIDPDVKMRATLVAGQAGRIAGLPVAEAAFRMLDDELCFTALIAEGSDVEAGTPLATLNGNARAILSAERVALNLLQRMSGIATVTRDICRKVSDFPVKITDTRKTLPGLRIFDKYAVARGGGVNHRFGLYDAVMIKDNHIAAAGSLTAAVRKVKESLSHLVKIEVEVDTLELVREAVELDVDAILFDNMRPSLLRQAVEIVGGRILTEASGRITPENVREYAATGVDLISLGWLTHSVRALDISLEVDR